MTTSAVPSHSRNQVDAITAEVIAHRLRSCSDEMMATLVKTAYSPNIKERRDCSTGIFDAQGRLLALTAIAPLHLSSLIGTIESVLERFPIDRMRRDDAFVVNDPYNGGGSHLPDITMVAPVYSDSRIVAFVANIAHHSDVGGKVPGSESSDCTSIFQEGIRLPPVRLFDQGQLDQGILDIILLNSRTPREREGDLKAQIATNLVGRARVEEIFTRFGTATTLGGIEAWLDYSENRARAGIRKLPKGSFENEDFIDHDGLAARMVRAKVKVTIHDDRLTFDFTGSDRQMPGSRNMVWNATLAGVYYAVKALVDPDLPPNAGYFRAVDVIAPAGTIFNAQSPAAVGDRGSTGNILGDLIFGAFAQAVPERVMAGCGPLHAVTFSGVDARRGEYFVNYETYAGASGAQHDQDGKDAVRVHVSGAANLPVEAAEHEFPLAILRYELIPDSARWATCRTRPPPGRCRAGLVRGRKRPHRSVLHERRRYARREVARHLLRFSDSRGTSHSSRNSGRSRLRKSLRARSGKRSRRRHRRQSFGRGRPPTLRRRAHRRRIEHHNRSRRDSRLAPGNPCCKLMALCPRATFSGSTSAGRLPISS
jgi:N-methylhydantoinase B